MVGCEGATVRVKVLGKGSFQNSSGLRDFAREMIERGFRDFRVDLSDCPLMDSTFMGTLAGIALKLRELPESAGLTVERANERNRDLLMNLGLDKLLTIAAEPVGEAGPVPGKLLASASPDKLEKAEAMLKAHEALVEAAPENIVKFKDVLDYLRQDLDRKL